jgi:phosphopantetheine adenylyltransferase
MPIGVFPGSFDPLTTAHLAVAEAAISTCRLDRLDLALSRVALGKDHGGHSTIAERVAAIDAARRRVPQLGVVITDDRLIADIAAGYDVCVVGADKWHQLHDVSFYDDSARERDAALARLPPLAVAPRAGVASPASGARTVLLPIDPEHAEVSSTAVRAGRDDWRTQP